MTELKNIRWGIIGCGDVTERKSGPAYQQTPGFELAAVMRRDAEKARDYAARHGVSFASGRVEDLLESDEIDAVYIATPPDSHLSYALKVAEAGKICCVEKPMAPSLIECHEMCAAFETRGLPLFVAYYRRTLPRFLKVKKLQEAGQIGTPRHVQWTFCAPPHPNADREWRTDRRIAPGGLFDDLASHGLDLLIFLLGEVEVAEGITRNQQALYSAADAVSACWCHCSGVTGSGTWNFGSALHQDRLEIHGDKGCLHFSVFAPLPLVLETPGHRETYHIPHPDPVQLYHVRAMADQLFREVPHPSTGHTALHTAWVMDRILVGGENETGCSGSLG